ncbi:hypothetical protein SBV1_1490019 [Verrucomicrobia bacterium]|nr:hypothetical protein SBV1_1490019 [Verrucomicrobiota bacterium]
MSPVGGAQKARIHWFVTGPDPQEGIPRGSGAGFEVPRVAPVNSAFSLSPLGRLRDALVRLLGRLGPQQSPMFTAFGTVGRLFTPMSGSPNDKCRSSLPPPRKTAFARPRFARESD